MSKSSKLGLALICVIVFALAMLAVLQNRQGADDIDRLNTSTQEEYKSASLIGPTAYKDHPDSDFYCEVLAFDDTLFGFDGYYEGKGDKRLTNDSSYWKERVYYAKVLDEAIPIAYSFGYGEDYYIDCDNDGLKELVCNCTDKSGQHTLRIYKKIGDKIYQGRLNYDLCSKNGYSIPDSATTQTYFDTLFGTIKVRITKDRGCTINDFSLVSYELWVDLPKTTTNIL